MKFEKINEITKSLQQKTTDSVLTEKELTRKFIKISIKVDDKHTFDISVNLTDRVCDIIDFIKERSGIHGLNMKLMYDGIYLEDDCSVEQCELVNGGMLYLMHGLRGGMQIFVKNIEGKIYTIEVSGNEKISDLKNKVYEKSGFAPNEQRLVFKGTCLSDEHTIKEVGLQSSAEINLVIRQNDSIEVHCKASDNRRISTNIELSQTVNDLIRLICDQTGMNAKDIDILFERQMLVGTRSIRESGLTNDSEVDVIATKSTGCVLCIIVGLFVLFLAYEFYRFLNG